MKNQLLFCIASFLLLTCGCATSTVSGIKAQPGEKSSSGRPVVAHMQAMNSGVFLFYYIPLWSGKENRPNLGKYATFENNVERKHMRKMLDLCALRFGGDAAEDVKIHTRSTGIWTLWILWKRSVHGTASAVKTKK